MDMHGAKMKMLEELIASMDGHILEPFNKKGKGKEMPAEMSVDIEAKPEDAMAVGAPEEGGDPGESDELRKLLEMYKAQEHDEGKSEVC